MPGDWRLLKDRVSRIVLRPNSVLLAPESNGIDTDEALDQHQADLLPQG